MKRFTALVLLAGFLVAPIATLAADDDVIKRGAEIGDSPKVTVAEVMKSPEKFRDKSVILEGTITAVCQTKGCWMELVPDTTDTTVRVTFEAYGFFVPKDSHGMVVRAEGRFETKVLSKEDADHLEGEGASLARNPDGTVTEIGFVATGVELRRPEASDSDPESESKPETESKSEPRNH